MSIRFGGVNAAPMEALSWILSRVYYQGWNDQRDKMAAEIAALERKRAAEKAALEGQLKAACDARDDFAKAAWELEQRTEEAARDGEAPRAAKAQGEVARMARTKGVDERISSTPLSYFSSER